MSAHPLGKGASYHWLAESGEIDMTIAAPEPVRLRLPTTPRPVTIDLLRTAIVVVDM